MRKKFNLTFILEFFFYFLLKRVLKCEILGCERKEDYVNNNVYLVVFKQN